MGLILVSQGNALCCSVLSVAGAIFLFILGLMFQSRVEELVEGREGEVPANPQAVARACYIAAVLYLTTFGFCFCQNRLITQKKEEEQRQLLGSRARSD